jgi:hypothetical protein
MEGKSAELRRKAEHCRRLAIWMDERTKAALLAMAEECEAEASREEQINPRMPEQ